MSRQDYIQATNKAGFEKALKEGKISEEQIGFIEEEDLIWAKGNYYGAVPDNEDLTKDKDGKLQFSDRSYNPANFSGKGYKILRKNIVQERNVLTQEMMAEPNTIYEVRYDFDLSGETINVPEGCVLKFEGGSLKNGTVNLNGTLITAGLYQIFYNITTKGYSPSECQVEWFGAKSYSSIDTEFVYSSDSIQAALDSCFKNIYFNVGIYYIDKTLVSTYHKTLNFKGSYNGPVKTTYNYDINNANASTLCVLTDIDVLHIKCECNKTPNDIDSAIKVLGYGVIDSTKVSNYNSTAVKIIIKDVNVWNSVIELILVNRNLRYTTVEEAEREQYGNSIGIELVNNSTKDSLSIYGAKISGIIANYRYGIKNNIKESNFPTAFTITSIFSRCITAIDFGESGIAGSNIKCDYIQTAKLFTENNRENYPLFTGWIRKIYFDTYVWDLGLTDNSLYNHKYIIKATDKDIFTCSPLMYDNYYTSIVGDFQVNSPYNNLKLISKFNTFEKNSPYYIDFLTNDYLNTDNYTIGGEDISIIGNPFSIKGAAIKKDPSIIGKSLSITLKNNTYIGINKVIIEASNTLLHHFESITVQHKNTSDIIFKEETFINDGKYNNFICISENLIHGVGYKETIITFNNFIEVVTDSVFSNIIIKVSGFRHTYEHINTQSSTIIKPDGVFSLHGHKFRSVSNENQTYLENQSNGGKFYSTAGQPRYFKNEDIINAVKASPNAYGNGAQFYKYTFKEGSLVIYDKTNDKYFALKGSLLGKATSGTFNEKPDVVPEGYLYLVKDVKSDGNTEFKPIYAKEDGDYIDALGNPANALKKGTTSQRPTGVQPGFHYFDTDLGHDMVWDGQEWYDPTNKDEFSDLYKIMYNQHASVSVSSNVPGNIIEKGVPKAVTLSWNYIFNGASTTPDTLQLKSGQDVLVGDKGTKTYTDNIQDTKTYQVVSIMKGVTKTAGITINAYYPIYYGGSSKTTLTSDDVLAFTKHGSIKSNPSGSYNFQVDAGEYAWICVPAGMVINKVTSNGFGVPIEPLATVAVTGKGNYNCYRSSETFTSGMFSCVVG